LNKQNLKPLTNIDITIFLNKHKIKKFRGVFMIDTLPKKSNNIECGIVNLDTSNNSGTHWVAYYKNKNKSYYFDSFGVDPPGELKNYLNTEIISSTFQIQKFNTNNCGYYCLLVLKLMEKYDYRDIIIRLLESSESLTFI
jgi:hypothetical protein